jgi:serine/threonine-protein kinase
MKTSALAVALVLSLATGVAAQQPDLVPPGWTRLPDQADQPGPRYASPDGRGVLLGYASPAKGSVRDEMDAIAFRDGERITYQRRSRSWIAVSGYKGDRIFYRKSNLACGGQRWHHVALEYPAADKRKMDRTVTWIAHGMNRYDACRRRAGTG